jgi:dUTPase
MKYCLWESCRQCTKDAVDQNTFEFVLLSDGAKVPQKATLGSTGFDVYSPREVTIHAQKTMKKILAGNVKVGVQAKLESIIHCCLHLDVRSGSCSLGSPA